MKDLKSDIKKLSEEYEEFKKSFGIKEKQTYLLELEAKTTDPSLWDDQENAKAVMQEFADSKKVI